MAAVTTPAQPPRVTREPIESLTPYPGNARTHDAALLAQSLATLGQYRPLVVQTRTRHVLAGNGTLAAARDLGWDAVDVTWVDADEDTARRIVLVDNRSSDVAGYDDTALAELLTALGEDFTATGYDADDFAALLASLAPSDPAPALSDVDDVPDVPTRPRTDAGDVWLLGPHRLICGDSTDPATFAALLGAQLVDAVWTDPPYGAAYTRAHFAGAPAGGPRTSIAGDNLDATGSEQLLRSAFRSALAACKPGACWYVAAPQGSAMLPFALVLTDLDIWRHTLVWVKDVFVMGRSDYHYRHEIFFYGWKPGAAHHPVPDRKQDSVWEVARPRRSRDHPTMKPVALITRALLNSTDPADVVLDPFAASGSTLIAAHTTGRKARLVELEPVYCDVIARRWQEHTGVLPVLERTGEAVDFTTAPA